MHKRVLLAGVFVAWWATITSFDNVRMFQNWKAKKYRAYPTYYTMEQPLNYMAGLDMNKQPHAHIRSGKDLIEASITESLQ
jgi:hypothetical protein